MKHDTVKRWLILGSLLALTLWLVLNIPEPETDVVVNPVNISTQRDSRAFTPALDVMPNAHVSLQQRFATNEESIDLFGLQQEIKPKQKIKLVVKPKSVPKAPPLPFSYIGKLVEDNVVKVFVLEGQALHVLGKGDKIGKNYQLKDIDDQQINWLYLPLNITQYMSIGKAP